MWLWRKCSLRPRSKKLPSHSNTVIVIYLVFIGVSVIFFQFIPAGLIILLCVQVKLLFLASVPAVQRMKVLLQCGAHQWKAVEEHCRDAVREKKKKRNKSKVLERWKKNRKINFHCVTFISIRIHKMLNELPECICPALFHFYLTMSSCYSHSVYISREEVQEVTSFNQKNPQSLLRVILSGELSLVCVSERLLPAMLQWTSQTKL